MAAALEIAIIRQTELSSGVTMESHGLAEREPDQVATKSISSLRQIEEGDDFS